MLFLFEHTIKKTELYFDKVNKMLYPFLNLTLKDRFVSRSGFLLSLLNKSAISHASMLFQFTEKPKNNHKSTKKYQN